MSPHERREMIRKVNTNLSLTLQYKLLKISHLSIYYTPVGMNAEMLKFMHEIDEVLTKYSFFGSRQITAYLPQSGVFCRSSSCLAPDEYLGFASYLQGA